MTLILPALPHRVAALMLDDAERVAAAKIHHILVRHHVPASYLAADACEELTIGLIGDARLRHALPQCQDGAARRLLRALLRDGERARARLLRQLRQLGRDRLCKAWRSQRAGPAAPSPLARYYPTSDTSSPVAQAGNAAPSSSDVGYATACATPDRR